MHNNSTTSSKKRLIRPSGAASHSAERRIASLNEDIRMILIGGLAKHSRLHELDGSGVQGWAVGIGGEADVIEG